MILSYTISRFEPLQIFLGSLPKKFLPFRILTQLLTCSKCLGLWLGILITQDIWIAMIISFLMVVFEKTFGEWEQKIKLD